MPAGALDKRQPAVGVPKWQACVLYMAAENRMHLRRWTRHNSSHGLDFRRTMSRPIDSLRHRFWWLSDCTFSLLCSRIHWLLRRMLHGAEEYISPQILPSLLVVPG